MMRSGQTLRRGAPLRALAAAFFVPETREVPPAHDKDVATAGGSGAPDQPQDEEQHHRADDRHDEAADAPLEIGPPSREEAKQEPAHEGADDADDDVLEPALLSIRSRDHAGHPARQRPEDDPGDDAETAFQKGLLSGEE